MDCSNLSDEELLTLIKDDSWSAFEVLFSRYSNRLYGYFLKKVNQEEAQDLTQKCLVRIHEKAHTFDASYPAPAWIFTIARNLLNDEFRKRSRDVKLREKYVHEIASQEYLEQGQLWAMLQDDIEKLDTRQKNALLLRYHEGRDFQEIANELEITISNARQLVSRAVRNLRQVVKNEEDR